jgi:hypothetical protein
VEPRKFGRERKEWESGMCHVCVLLYLIIKQYYFVLFYSFIFLKKKTVRAFHTSCKPNIAGGKAN